MALHMVLALLLIAFCLAPPLTAAPGPSRGKDVLDLLQRQKWEDYEQYRGISPASFTCKSLRIKQPLDHFANNSEAGSWSQRVFVCPGFWKRGAQEPLYFYVGYEGALSRPFPTIASDWAKQDGGLLVYAEHRYYGKSLPFGSASFTKENFGWLTAEQALADYAMVVAEVRKIYEVPSTAPTVALGGSYAGNLAAYLRRFYPEQFTAVLASGAVMKFLAPAPPYQQSKLGSFKVLSETILKAGGRECYDKLKLGFETMGQLATSAAGRQQLGQAAKMCSPGVFKSPLQVARFASNIAQSWWGTVQVLDEARENTVAKNCNVLGSGGSGANEGLQAVNALAIEALDGDPCFDSSWAASYWEFVRHDLVEDDAYTYQTCREGFPYSDWFDSSTAAGSIFGNITADLALIKNFCQGSFGVIPKPPRRLLYSDSKFAQAGNIVFSNGEYDPWSAGSVLKSLTPNAIAVITPRISHCYDLFPASKSDTKAVKASHAQIKKAIYGMIFTQQSR